MNFSIMLKELWEKNGYTQEELGSLLNLSKNAISHYENSTNSPSLETVERIADIFDVSVDYLIGRTKNNIPYSKLSQKLTNSTTLSDVIEQIASLDKTHCSTLVNLISYTCFHNTVCNKTKKQ